MRSARRRPLRRLMKKQLDAHVKKWALESFKTRHSIEVSYRGGLDVARDRAITKAVGKPSEGSGMMMLTGLRDVRFEFKTERSALAAVYRVKKAVRGVRFMLHSSKQVGRKAVRR
jgi:hypothetical protein